MHADADRALADIAAVLGLPTDATPAEVVEAVRAMAPAPTTIGEWDRGIRRYRPSGELAAAVSRCSDGFAWDVWRDGAAITFDHGVTGTIEAARDAADRALGIIP